MTAEDAEALAEIQRRSYAAALPGLTAAWPEANALDAAALQAFLDEQRYAVLATARPDGRPQASPVGFVVADRAFWIATVRGTRLRNVRAVAWASLVVMEERPHTAVSAEGPVRIHEGEALEAACARLARSWQARYDHPLEWAAALLELAPERLFSHSAPEG